MRTRFVLVLAVALIGMSLTAGSDPVSHAGAMSAIASRTGPQQITLSWDWYEFESLHPTWDGLNTIYH